MVFLYTVRTHMECRQHERSEGTSASWCLMLDSELLEVASWTSLLVGTSMEHVLRAHSWI
jgi:hypothetical protein